MVAVKPTIWTGEVPPGSNRQRQALFGFLLPARRGLDRGDMLVRRYVLNKKFKRLSASAHYLNLQSGDFSARQEHAPRYP
jgi:hypothetical protein